MNHDANIAGSDVPLPSEFGLHYEDLELKTPDGVILKCFLIPQKADLGAGSVHIDIKRGVTEEEVSQLFGPLSVVLSVSLVHRQSADRYHVSW